MEPPFPCFSYRIVSATGRRTNRVFFHVVESSVFEKTIFGRSVMWRAMNGSWSSADCVGQNCAIS